MKKIKFFLIILCLKAHPVFSQLNSIFIDSVLIRINYTNSNDSIIKFEYSIYNLSNSSIYVAGELKNDLVKVGGIFEIQNGSCDFTIGYNDPTFNLVSFRFIHARNSVP